MKLSEIENTEGGLSVPMIPEIKQPTPTSDRGNSSAKSTNRLSEKRASAIGKKPGELYVEDVCQGGNTSNVFLILLKVLHTIIFLSKSFCKHDFTTSS